MVEIAEIRDRDSLQAWLVALTVQVGEEEARRIALSLAWRAVARVLPVWWQAILSSEAAVQFSIAELPVLRCVLVAGVAAGTQPEKVLRRACMDASVDVGLEIGEVANAAAFVADAVAYGRTADAVGAMVTLSTMGGETWRVVNADLEAMRVSEIHISFALAQDELSAASFQYIKGLLKRRGTLSNWTFWLEWYDNLQKGAPEGSSLSPCQPDDAGDCLVAR